MTTLDMETVVLPNGGGGGEPPTVGNEARGDTDRNAFVHEASSATQGSGMAGESTEKAEKDLVEETLNGTASSERSHEKRESPTGSGPRHPPTTGAPLAVEKEDEQNVEKNIKEKVEKEEEEEKKEKEREKTKEREEEKELPKGNSSEEGKKEKKPETEKGNEVKEKDEKEEKEEKKEKEKEKARERGEEKELPKGNSPDRSLGDTRSNGAAKVVEVRERGNDEKEKDEKKVEKDMDEKDAEKGPSIAVYKRRWVVLAVFCLFSFSQACVWNTFGPISSTSSEAFGWTDANIALLANWGPISYVLTCFLFSWMLDVKGLRWGCLFSAFLVLAGVSLRCITMETPYVTWLMHVGHFLNGAGGPVAMGGPPIVSAVWFPLHERATATAIGTACNYFGVAVSFIMGPYIVSSHRMLAPNTTEEYLVRKQRDVLDYNPTEPTDSGSDIINTNMSAPQYVPDIDKERAEIQLYMFVALGWCGALFLLMLVFLPKKPPLPPCASAAIQREDFTKGLKHLLTQRQFWLVTLIYGVSFGVVMSWASMLNVIMSPQGVSEKDAGWMGFYSTVASCLLCLIVARFADHFSRIMKQFIIALYVLSLAFFLVFALACADVISSSLAIYYTTIVGGFATMNSAIPLIYELSCELAYPTGEGTTSIVITTTSNVVGLAFLFIEMTPGIGTVWMNWTVVGSLTLCLPCWVLLKETYGRLAVDELNPTMDAINLEITIHPEIEMKPRNGGHLPQ